MHVCAYGVVIEPLLGRLPVYECISSLYNEVDEFLILDLSKYDNIDLSMYEKVNHVKGIFNCFDNPFGSAYSTALNLASKSAEYLLFLDLDEIFEFHTSSLKDIIKRYPMQDGVGIAFSLRNYYCSRNFVIDGCSSKGSHVFRVNNQLGHDALNGYWQHRSRIRRTNNEPDSVDGVRLCNEQCMPMMHYQPIPLEEVCVHHTSHLDLAGKMVRSILQYNHTSTLDLLDFFPIDLRPEPQLIEKVYDLVRQEINNGDIELYGLPERIEYEGNKFLDSFVKRCGIMEFNPEKVKDYQNWINKKREGELDGNQTKEDTSNEEPKTMVIKSNFN